MTEETKIVGMKELYEALSTKIPRNMEGKVLQKALGRGTLILKRQVEQNIGPGYPFPKDVTGTLRRSVYAKRSKFDNTATFEARIVGIRHGRAAAKRKLDAYYATWVEFGHKGVSARPFMRPAFETTKGRAFTAILDGLATQLDVAKKGANW